MDYTQMMSGKALAGRAIRSVAWDQINPGNTVHGKIAFDMPDGVHAVKAELHDSMFSGGVTVNLK